MTETLILLGTFLFGVVVGWQVYMINRYRTATVDLGDLATEIGLAAGGPVMNLCPSGTAMCGAYGIGMALGYFLYFLVLFSFVRRSPNFDVDWFLDGRRQAPQGDYIIPEGTRQTSAAMGDAPAADAQRRGPIT